MVSENENYVMKPVELRLKSYLLSYPDRGRGRGE